MPNFSIDKLLKYGKHYTGSLALAETKDYIHESHWPESPVLLEEWEALYPLKRRVFKTVKTN